MNQEKIERSTQKIDHKKCFQNDFGIEKVAIFISFGGKAETEKSIKNRLFWDKKIISPRKCHENFDTHFQALYSWVPNKRPPPAC